MDFSNQFRHKNYNNFANNRYNNRFRARVRGRGHSLHASHQRHNWRAIQPQQQASDRFGQPSNSSFTQLQSWSIFWQVSRNPGPIGNYYIRNIYFLFIPRKLNMLKIFQYKGSTKYEIFYFSEFFLWAWLKLLTPPTPKS